MIVERQLHKIVRVPRWLGLSCQPTFMAFVFGEDVVFCAKASVLKAPSKTGEALMAISDGGSPSWLRLSQCYENQMLDCL